MTVFADLSVSLEGFVAGPEPSMKDPLGVGGEQLHEWAIAAMAWREAHGHEGGEEGVDSDVIKETVGRTGAGIMGRKMFSGGSGGWEVDPNPRGWGGDELPVPPTAVRAADHPPPRLSHHPLLLPASPPPEQLEMQGGTTFVFVTEGFAAALAQAREA